MMKTAVIINISHYSRDFTCITFKKHLWKLMTSSFLLKILRPNDPSKKRSGPPETILFIFLSPNKSFPTQYRTEECLLFLRSPEIRFFSKLNNLFLKC